MPSQSFIDDTQRQKSITVPATTARGFKVSGIARIASGAVSPQDGGSMASRSTTTKVDDD